LQNQIRKDSHLRSAQDGKKQNQAAPALRNFDIEIDFGKIFPPQDQWVEEIDYESEKEE
jgi:hypothetical protein